MRRLAVWIFLWATPAAFASGTGIGNGGDVLFQYLESMRQVLLQTLAHLPKELGKRPGICDQADLTGEQKIFCGEYFDAIGPEVVKLNGGKVPVDFVLRTEPLEVAGPDGRPQRVAARTPLGPSGAVEFHYGTIATYSPKQILFLIAHEMGHKSQFRGLFVSDNDPIGPFPRGRQLVDAFARSVVALAEADGRVGDEFRVFDYFSCSIFLNGNEVSMGSGASPRRYRRKGDFSSYQTSVGMLPLDFSLGIPESKFTRLFLRAEFNEATACVGAGASARGSVLRIVRVTDSPQGPTPPEILTEKTTPGFNPTCEKESGFSVEYGALKFSCEFNGSFTQAQRLRRK